MAKTAIIQAQQRWEYEVITRKSETYLTRELNGFGEVGWDVITIIFGKDRKGDPAWHAFLKRPYSGPPRKISMDAGSAGAAIFLVTLAFNLLGDAVRDVFDPRTRRSAT